MDYKRDPFALLKIVANRIRYRVSDGFALLRNSEWATRITRRTKNYVFRANIFIQRFGKRITRTIDTITIVAALWCLLNFIWQLGFEASTEITHNLLTSNRICISFFGVIQIFKLFNYLKSDSRIPIYEIAYAIINWAYIYLSHSETFAYYEILNHSYVVNCMAALIAVNEISRLGLATLSRRISPTILFIGSFLFIIALGTGLLMMPRCHTTNITFLEALFTSTASVCVTGIPIVDVPTTFTGFGQGVILLLIQIGGLGVMTFTCFFALSLNGRTSLQNRIVIRDLISVENMTDIFVTLKRIFYVTLIIEAFCAWLIYAHLSAHNPEADTYELIFTSVFHSVSAFCNAGVSNLDGGMQNPLMGNSRFLQLTIAFAAFIGGAGFPVQSNAINWLKHKIGVLFDRICGRYNGHNFRSRLINANSRIIFFSHVSLLFVGAAVYFFSEASHTMAGESFFGRIADSFFLSSISRSSGFSFVEMTGLSSVSLLAMAALMWVGCAPLSTGGGVKTTTLALLVLNLKNALIRKENIEVFGRRISGHSLRRAFATAFLSFVAIGISAVAMKMADPQVPLTQLLYDSNAALSTAGLAIGNVAELSHISQSILIADMFIGRIGVFAFLMCFFPTADKQYYKYPTEHITI